MFLEGMRKPASETFFQWDGTNTEELQDYLRQEGSSVTESVTLTDNEDGTATLINDTGYWGVYQFTLESDDWYLSTVTYQGPTPVPYTLDEIRDLFTPFPEYPPLEPPNSDV